MPADLKELRQFSFETTPATRQEPSPSRTNHATRSGPLKRVIVTPAKRVIVTPAVNPRLFELLHFDIQSTGQKSRCVNTGLRPSQSSVLIKQSDSLCPLQFLPGAHPAATSPLSSSSTRPAHGPAPPRGGQSEEERAPSFDPRASTLRAPQKPILLPKLRIRLADFPCLHCSLSARGFSPRRPDAVNRYALDALGLSKTGSDFQGTTRRSPDATRTGRAFRPRRQLLLRTTCFRSRLLFRPYKEKRTLPGARVVVSELGNASPLRPRARGTRSNLTSRGSGIGTRFPFGSALVETARFAAFAGRPQARLYRDRSPVSRSPAPLRPSRVSLECLLLPPRSARPAAPAALTCDLLRHRPACLLVRRVFVHVSTVTCFASNGRA